MEHKREPFEEFDLSGFWDDNAYALQEYVCDPPTDELITAVEGELGYRLPNSYIWLMRQHNGGIPVNRCFPSSRTTSWAKDHVAISGIFGIGQDQTYSLCGELGSRFMIEEWGYPDLGVAVCDCPSAGHDMIFLDYRECGPEGEPCVVHVDQELDYEVTWMAENFEAFIRGLVNESVYDTSKEDREDALELTAHGALSPLLGELCVAAEGQEGLTVSPEQTIRRLCTQVVEEKGFLALHDEERSSLLYDFQFWLYTRKYQETTEQGYLKCYPRMLACPEGEGTLSCGGYALDFISDWLQEGRRTGRIVSEGERIRFSKEASEELVRRLNALWNS